MSTIIKDLEEKLGTEKVEEIVEKEWKVVEPPSEEELAKEEPAHPKARNNPNSRKNLAQYNKRTKEAKEKAIQNLKVVEVEEDVDPKAILGEDFDVSIIENIMPVRSILKDRSEQEIFYNTVNLFVKDFDFKELSFSDIDDIITLALNRVLELRLLKTAKSGDKLVLEASNTLERFRKHSDKVKQNLASRRVDRIDSKTKPALSIVDLAAHLDEQKKLDFQKRMDALEKAHEDFVPPKRDADGNIIEDE